MPLQISNHAIRRCSLSAATVAATFFAAAPAQAARWEQISRANGGQGAALFSNRSIPVFASDTGRFAMWQQQALLNSYDRSRRAPTKLRNVVDNTTRTVGAPVSEAFRYGNSEVVQDVTNDEKTMLMSAPNPTPSGTTDRDVYRFFLRPVAGGPDVTVALSDYSDEFVMDGVISGDGSTVATVSAYGVQVVDVATGTSTSYPIRDTLLTISDDGKVIAGASTYGESRGFTIIDGVFTQVAARATVSADGSTLVLTQEPGYPATTSSIEVRGVRTGTSATFTAPPAGLGKLIWVSPDGNRIAFAGPSEGAQAAYLKVSKGTWAKFGREFSTSLDADSRISRNGRFAVIEYARTSVLYRDYLVGQAALVDLTGTDLPGTTEALSASSYFAVTPPLAPSYCYSDGTMRASYGRPAPWGPLPRRGELTVTIDGVQAFHGVYRDPTEADIEIPFAKDAKSATIKVNVTDYLGRKLSTEQTIAVQCRYDAP